MWIFFWSLVLLLVQLVVYCSQKEKKLFCFCSVLTGGGRREMTHRDVDVAVDGWDRWKRTDSGLLYLSISDIDGCCVCVCVCVCVSVSPTIVM